MVRWVTRRGRCFSLGPTTTGNWLKLLGCNSPSIAVNRLIVTLPSALGAIERSGGATVNVTMPLVTQFYGMREFAIVDPDGYVITFAQRVG